MSKEKELKKLGGNVKRIRLEQGLSQTDVAKNSQSTRAISAIQKQGMGIYKATHSLISR